MKLQDAYVSETGKYVGKWKAIGYTMSKSTASFSYDDKLTVTEQNAISTAIPTSAGAAWEAKTNVGLNDCAANSTWTLWIKADASGNGLNWGAGVKKGAAGAASTDMDSECSVLTPQFINFRTTANGVL